MKVAWITTLQALVEGGGYPEHPVLPEELLAQERGHHHAGGGPMGAAVTTPSLSADWNPNPGPR